MFQNPLAIHSLVRALQKRSRPIASPPAGNGRTHRFGRQSFQHPPKPPTKSEAFISSIVWFRNNLRLSDNPPLREAAERGPLLPVFIGEPSRGASPEGARHWWRARSLRCLDHSLSRLGAPLLFLRGDPAILLPDLATRLKIDKILAMEAIDPDGRRTQSRLQSALSGKPVEFHLFPADYLVPPAGLPAERRSPWKVFTPFWQRAQSHLPHPLPLPAPDRLDGIPFPRSETPEDWGWEPEKPDWAAEMRSFWDPGEEGARRRLNAFLEKRLKNYAVKRDFLDEDTSSLLSPHLANGEISIRSVWWSLRESTAPEEDRAKFLSELGWREFSAHLMWHHPDLATQPLQKGRPEIAWREDPSSLLAWQKGRTGIPLVDAGMRQLRRLGFLPNRVRMVTASFLVKNLLIDWRKGREWFSDNLVDHDPANNAASWQWISGYGADAAPWFRIFNPVLQGEKFDPEGRYVKTYLPELARIPPRYLHCPWTAPSSLLDNAGIGKDSPYRNPIVDLGLSRKRALQAWTSGNTPDVTPS
ncbi:cryptochrome/photolyase family protein [Leptospirillum ferriphilum]|uniref:cryptochrome/photolyase family protein n=1 Tax=Leptospirillum ferriphilum TaxID=178606 RepID=UPI000987B146|nr:deoxyribodipyrimidine photo-lyase [Leptospirillum ferriphilum]